MAIEEAPKDFQLPNVELRQEHDKNQGVAWLTKSRVENLADGVFSIAMTLLVLDLKVPKLVDSVDRTELWGSITHLMPRFASYLVGFAVIGVYWVGHHMQFHYIRRTDRLLLWMNIVFLAAISFLPFPTSVLGEYPNNLAAVLFFGASIFVTSCIFLVHFLYAALGRRCVDENMTTTQVRQVAMRIAVLPITALVGMLVAPINPSSGLIVYVSAAVLYLIPGAIDKIKQPAKRKHKIPSELF